jgi:hypothetical protein
VIALFPLLAVLHPEDIRNKKYGASDSLGIAELTLEEMQLYQPDFLPLSLAERGRQSVTSWRGMPPGYLNYDFETILLVMPLWGYWDNQLVPIEFIRHRQLTAYSLEHLFIPQQILPSDKPVTRVAFSQDYQFELSYLDVNLARFYQAKSFFHLSGNNFLRGGSFPGFTNTKVNTYRGQIHHQFSDKFQLDFWYWQLRHKFSLSPVPELLESQSVKRIGHISWFSLTYLPDSTSKIVIIPYGYQWADRYRLKLIQLERKTEIYSIGLKTEYTRSSGKARLRVLSDIVRHDITSAFVYKLEDQWDGKILVNSDFDIADIRIKLGAGYRFLGHIGSAPEFRFHWGWNLPFQFSSEVSAVRTPQNLPLSSLFWSDDSISAIKNPEIPVRQGIEWRLKLPKLWGSLIEVTHYYNQFLNAWRFDRLNSKFIQEDYDNSGISASIQKKLMFLYIDEQFSYNSKYQRSFSPQIRNVLIINIPISMFKGALKLDPYLIYHYIGKWHQLDYDPYTNQYILTQNEIGEYHIIDGKILAHIKSATLFAVWENLLSEDYVLVDGYREFFRIFRFGIYWTLFD